MSFKDILNDLKKTISKDKNPAETVDRKKSLESSKSIKSNNSSSEKEKINIFPTIPERELQTDFSLSFKEIYNIHMAEIESKTNLKRKHIYIFLLISLFFFLIGHFELFFCYIITGYFPLKWTIQDYKANKEHWGKKWGTYWFLFVFFIFFDLHKKEVLKIIPLYFIVKTIFLLILYLPGFTAAINLYDGVFKDILQKLSLYFQNKEDNDTLLNAYKKHHKQKTE
jgi:receptor expression-enhancing protein 5/6